jgi:alginate O-acetyltransferase complex protein AlgI
VTVFFLCGLWHGASWTFVIWGLWHGLFLVLERTPFGRLLDRLGRPLRILYAQLAVVVGWVFFRSEDLTEAMRYLKAMAGLNTGASGAYHVSLYATGEVLTFLVLGLLVSIPTAAWCRGLLSNSPALNGDAMPLAGTMRYVYALFLCGVFLLACMSLAGGTHNPFIYQQF